MMENKDKGIGNVVILLLDLLVVASVSYAVLGMFFSRSNGVLVAGGWSAFKYYTVLSNVFCALSCLCSVLFCIFRKEAVLPSWLYIFRLMGSSVVTVTLLVVLVFLGPRLGYALMFEGVNLWLHLIAPVLAITGQLLLKSGKRLPFRASLWGIVPTAVYGGVYIMVNAVGWTGKSNPVTDVYRFLSWGWGVGIAIFAGIFLINWMVSVLFWRLGRMR